MRVIGLQEAIDLRGKEIEKILILSFPSYHQSLNPEFNTLSPFITTRKRNQAKPRDCSNLATKALNNLRMLSSLLHQKFSSFQLAHYPKNDSTKRWSYATNSPTGNNIE